MKTTSFDQIFGQVARETEKAICLTAWVQWGNGAAKAKDVWFPKSTIRERLADSIIVAHDMVYSISMRNAFKGYPMEFAVSASL